MKPEQYGPMRKPEVDLTNKAKKKKKHFTEKVYDIRNVQQLFEKQSFELAFFLAKSQVIGPKLSFSTNIFWYFCKDMLFLFVFCIEKQGIRKPTFYSPSGNFFLALCSSSIIVLISLYCLNGTVLLS